MGVNDEFLLPVGPFLNCFTRGLIYIYICGHLHEGGLGQLMGVARNRKKAYIKTGTNS